MVTHCGDGDGVHEGWLPDAAARATSADASDKISSEDLIFFPELHGKCRGHASTCEMHAIK
jgi:hypothetical protein